MADEPVSAAPTIVTPTIVPAFQELTPPPQPTADATTSAERQRDATGRFVGKEPSAPPVAAPVAVAAPTPKFAQNLVDLAKSVYYTDEQIAKFDDPSMLFDAVRGRAAAMQAQQPPHPQWPPSTPPPTAPNVEPTFEALKLDFSDDEVAPEVVKHLRTMETYANTTAKKAFDENQQLRQQLAQVQGTVQQSAVSAQQVADQQRVGFWDQVAAAVPGMVEAIGKPSQAMARLGSPQANEWTEVAPFISARAQAQRVPEQYIDYVKAAQEGWTAYQSIRRNGNEQPRGSTTPTGLPGVALHSAARQSSAPAPKRNMTPAEDYAYRMAAMENAFQASGGQNPFAL